MSLPQIPGYEFRELLGEGGCGASYLCEHAGGAPRVVKVLNGLAVNPHLLGHALNTVARLGPNPPHLVPVHDFNLDSVPYWYATDYYGTQAGQPDTLRSLMGQLKRDSAWLLIEQLVGALAILHRYDVVHTNIKPENIFVAPRTESGRYDLRLGDFGQGLVAGIHYFEMGDTGFYASPEQLRTGDFSHGKGKRWDVYSFGVVAFQLLTGHLPRLDKASRDFQRNRNQREGSPTAALQQDDPVEFATALEQQPDVTWPNGPKNEYEQQLRTVVDRCLALDPEDRPVDLREVARAMETVRHNADVQLLKRQHKAQVRSKVIKLRTFMGTTAIFLLASILLLVSALMGFSKFGMALVEIDQAERRRKADLARLQAASDEELGREKNLRLAAEAEIDVLRRNADADIRELLQKESRARSFLKYSQDQADRFFAAVLAAGDIDFPGFQEERRASLREAARYFERFRETYHGDPDYARELARAHRFMGQIKMTQGRLTSALEDFALAKDTINGLKLAPEEAPRYTREVAEIDQLIAEIEILRGNFEVASDALDQSTARFQNLREIPGYSGDDLQVVKNRHRQAELLKRTGEADLALETFAGLADELTAQLEDAEGGGEAIEDLLGTTYLHIASIQLGRKNIDMARQFYQKAAEVFAGLVSRNGQVEDYQYHLAICLNQQGRIDRKTEMITDAHALLQRIVRLSPADHRYRLELAESYGHLAALQRDAGETEQALRLIDVSIEVLRQLLEEEPGIDRYKFALARHNMALAKLLGDQEKYRDAASRLEQTVAVCQELIREESGNGEYLTTLAKASGNAGFVRQKLGDKSKAIEHFEFAKAAWEKLLDEDPDDTEAEQGLAWVKDQLRRA